MSLKPGEIVSLDSGKWAAGHRSWFDDLWIVRQVGGEMGRSNKNEPMVQLIRRDDPDCWISAPESACDRASALLLLARQVDRQ